MRSGLVALAYLRAFLLGSFAFAHTDKQLAAGSHLGLKLPRLRDNAALKPNAHRGIGNAEEPRNSALRAEVIF